MELFAGLLPVLFLMLGDAPSLHLKEYERLQGVWVVRSAEYCFALADNDSPVGSTFTFEGKHVTISHWGRVYTV